MRLASALRFLSPPGEGETKGKKRGERENELLSGRAAVGRATRFAPEQRNAKTALTKERHFGLEGNKSFGWLHFLL